MAHGDLPSSALFTEKAATDSSGKTATDSSKEPDKSTVNSLKTLADASYEKLLKEPSISRSECNRLLEICGLKFTLHSKAQVVDLFNALLRFYDGYSRFQNLAATPNNNPKDTIEYFFSDNVLSEEFCCRRLERILSGRLQPTWHHTKYSEIDPQQGRSIRAYALTNDAHGLTSYNIFIFIKGCLILACADENGKRKLAHWAPRAYEPPTETRITADEYSTRCAEMQQVIVLYANEGNYKAAAVASEELKDYELEYKWQPTTEQRARTSAAAKQLIDLYSSLRIRVKLATEYGNQDTSECRVCRLL